MSRSRAAAIHLLPTLLLLGLIAALVALAWYPYPFWQFGKSGNFALTLVLAAGLAGPFLTLVVYKKGKRGMLFDLWFIAIVQLVAVSWGAYSLYENRPFWMVFTVDRFEVLSTRDVDTSWVSDPRFMERPIASPVLLFANMSADPVAYQNLLREIMFEGKPDLQFRPEHWSLYSEKKDIALQKSRPLASLRDARPEAAKKIDEAVNTIGGDITRLKFVPVMQKHGHFSAILDAQNGDVLDILNVDPWVD
jgi:hypothetical protein